MLDGQILPKPIATRFIESRMPPLLEDPRIRQTWNQLSQNAEQATESAAAGIWTFQHQYMNPCFSSIASSIEQCTASCFPDREERARRLRERGRTRGRAELSFDFYDDWDDEDGGRTGGLLRGWGNDELDRLLTRSGSHSGGVDNQAPRRKKGMSYGTRGLKRKSLDPDSTVIPSTSALGFLGRLPFKLGGTLRYKPSAADLQDHPGALHAEYREGEENEPLISDEHSDDELGKRKAHARTRSSTNSSGTTSDSFRSRGDLFPSDGEDDAIPLGDEFAMVLERRMTGSGADDRSSGRTRNSKGKRPAGSRTLSRTFSRTTQSSDSRPPLSGKRMSFGTSLPQTDATNADTDKSSSLTELRLEERRIQVEEDEEVERKHRAAARLAVERGLRQAEEHVEEFKQWPMAENIIDERQDPPDPSASVAACGVDIHVTETRELSDGPLKTNFVPARLPNFD